MNKLVTITLTPDTADELWYVINAHITHRTPVREYVDKRYADMDEAFRNNKIGAIQSRIDSLLHVQKQLRKE